MGAECPIVSEGDRDEFHRLQCNLMISMKSVYAVVYLHPSSCALRLPEAGYIDGVLQAHMAEGVFFLS